MEFVWCFLMVKFILRILVRIAQNNVVLCRSLFCLLSSLWNNDGSCEERKIVWAHTGFHVSFTVFPNSCSLYNLRHNTRTWKLTWVPGGPVVLCHFIPCAHLCDHRYQNTELFNHHEDLPHAASLWYIHSPLRLPPLGVSSLATTNLSPISVILSFREQYVDEFHSVWPL